MSVKLFELLFFAVISIVLINRLLSILGQMEEDESGQRSGRHKSFNTPGSIVDVTDTTIKQKTKILGLLSLLAKNGIAEKIEKARDLMHDFSPDYFFSGASSAFQMIVDAAIEKDASTISELVDKRYIESFTNIASSFSKINYTDLKSEIVDVNVFGHNVMIKVLFSDQNNTFTQEWTFSRSSIVNSPNWYLTNVDIL